MVMADVEEHRRRTEKDEDLPFVRACRDGDREAFGVLVERHQKKMMNTAYRMLGDYDEACDVVQDAFVSAFRSIGAFREESRFVTWLTGIVINRGRTRLRQLASRRRLEGPSRDGMDRADSGPDAGNPVFDTVAKRERSTRIQACISGLDEDQRVVLVLRDIQEFSYEEITDILKIPDGTVKSRLFRARLALRNCLKETMGDFL